MISRIVYSSQVNTFFCFIAPSLFEMCIYIKIIVEPLFFIFIDPKIAK